MLLAPGALAAAGCDSGRARPLSAIFQNWIVTLHPQVELGPSGRLPSGARLTSVIAPTGGVDIGDFLRESERGTSTWDVYVGMTPWVEMARLVEHEVIQPWDAYAEPAVVDDIVPRLRAEGMVDGHLYSWPFLVDVVVQGANGEIVERAGLDPTRSPASWDEYIGNARAVVRSGAAPFGCTFDPRGWRSLVPIAYSLGSDLTTEDGLFDFRHPASAEALGIMRRMLELANPDVLDPEAMLASISPDEAAFAAQTAAYYVKYANAHVRYSNAWPDPTRLRVDPLPAGAGPGGTVCWTTGIALLRHGGRKRAAAAYADALTHDEGIWRRSLGTGRDAVGQLPAFRSLPGYVRPAPAWLAPWTTAVVSALRTARTIAPHALGEEQFKVARPYWEEYLLGVERSPRRALARAMSAVRARARSVRG